MEAARRHEQVPAAATGAAATCRARSSSGPAGLRRANRSLLRGPLRAWARERLEDRRLYERFPLNRARVLQLLDLHLSGKRDTHPLLWAVLMLAPFA